jgi:hypothetical protein
MERAQEAFLLKALTDIRGDTLDEAAFELKTATQGIADMVAALESLDRHFTRQGDDDDLPPMQTP